MSFGECEQVEQQKCEYERERESINSTNIGRCRVLLATLQQKLHYNAHALLCDIQIMSHNDVIVA